MVDYSLTISKRVYTPVFASLENDYMGTRKLIIDSKSSLTSSISFSTIALNSDILCTRPLYYYLKVAYCIGIRPIGITPFVELIITLTCDRSLWK